MALKSLVTTQLAQVVAEANGVRCYNTFTGFKFMADIPISKKLLASVSGSFDTGARCV